MTHAAGSGARFRYCPLCGTQLVRRAPEASPRSAPSRSHCPACAFVHYRNPIAAVAGILLSRDGTLPPADHLVTPREAGAILLVRRAAEVSYPGHWCIPCGYIEYDEDVRRAMEREMHEESGLRVTAEEVYAVHSNFHEPHNHTVGIWFLGRYRGGALRAGDDAERARFYPLDRLPEPLAFPTDRKVLAALLREAG